MEQVVNIELSLNFKIDTENTSVEKYIYYVKQAQLIIANTSLGIFPKSTVD
jgi:hypothetical protein